MSSMTRRALLALCASPLAGQQGGRRDDAFSDIDFDRWLSRPEDRNSEAARIRWSSHLSEPQLSVYQRLLISVTAEVDGAELAKRRGKGSFLLLVQVTDDKGAVWQNHLDMDLTHMEEGMKSNNVDFTLFFFILPGEYQVSLAVYDDATSEHSVRRHRLHVNPLKNDPLPSAWVGLPSVEFIPVLEPPEKWYLPSIEGKLNLTASPREPVHIDLVVNLTASEHLAGSTQVQTRLFEILLPAAKVLSQVNWGDSPFGFTLLDLSRNRVLYQQENTRPVDWSRAGESLKDVNAGIIDAHALEQRQRTANFFVSEIRRRVRSAASRHAGGPPIVIVLSSAFRFTEPQTLQPVDHDGPYAAKVFYIRYQPPSRLLLPRIGEGRVPPPPIRADYTIDDQLAPLLKPLDPRIFEIGTGYQLRKALAAMFAEILKL
jgi:hypothetical protein